MANDKHKNFPWWVVTTAAGVAATAFIFMNFFMPYQSQKIEQLQEQVSTVSNDLDAAQKAKDSLEEKNHSLQSRIDALSKAVKEATNSSSQDCNKIQRGNLELTREISTLKNRNQRISQELSSAKSQIRDISQELSSAKSQIRELSHAENNARVLLKGCQAKLTSMQEKAIPIQAPILPSPTPIYSNYGYTISPRVCKHAYDGLNCTITIENMSDESRSIELTSFHRENYFIDDQGNQFAITMIKAGRDKDRYGVRRSLPPRTPANFTFIAEKFPRSSKLATLVFKPNPPNKVISLKNIPVSN